MKSFPDCYHYDLLRLQCDRLLGGLARYESCRREAQVAQPLERRRLGRRAQSMARLEDGRGLALTGARGADQLLAEPAVMAPQQQPELLGAIGAAPALP